MTLDAELDRLRPMLDGYGDPLFIIDPPVRAASGLAWMGVPPTLREFALRTASVRGNGLHLELDDALRTFEDSHLGVLFEIGNDGRGGYWGLDHAGRVWWCGHDPNVLTLAGRTIVELLQRAGQWNESMPDEAPVLPPSVKQALKTDPSATIRMEDMLAGEGFDFDFHRVAVSGDAFVVGLATQRDR